VAEKLQRSTAASRAIPPWLEYRVVETPVLVENFVAVDKSYITFGRHADILADAADLRNSEDSLDALARSYDLLGSCAYSVQ
jgi:hypothetical protein